MLRIVIISSIKRIKICIIVFVIILIAIISIPISMQKIIYKREYIDYVEKYAKEYNVDKNLIYAVIKAESNFKNDVKSNKDAIGLMQLIKTTAQDMCKEINLEIEDNDIERELLNPDININLGTKYLSILIDKYKNIELAVTAYNAGTGKVDSWIEEEVLNKDGTNLENIPYKETNIYVRKILRDYKIYTRQNK